MKKIRFTQALSTSRELFKAGDEREVSDPEAAQAVLAGVAVEVGEDDGSSRQLKPRGERSNKPAA